MARKAGMDQGTMAAVVVGYVVLGGALVWALFYRTPANGNDK